MPSTEDTHRPSPATQCTPMAFAAASLAPFPSLLNEPNRDSTRFSQSPTMFDGGGSPIHERERCEWYVPIYRRILSQVLTVRERPVMHANPFVLQNLLVVCGFANTDNIRYSMLFQFLFEDDGKGQLPPDWSRIRQPARNPHLHIQINIPITRCIKNQKPHIFIFDN